MKSKVFPAPTNSDYVNGKDPYELEYSVALYELLRIMSI